MKTFFLWLGVLLAVVGVAGSALFGAYVMDWSMAWTAAALAALAAIPAGLWFTVRTAAAWRRRRAAAVPAAPQGAEAAQRRKALDARWKAFVRHLRKAGGKGHGDPVTALPWYLVLGAPGSGKTAVVANNLTAVTASGLPTGAAAGAASEVGFQVLKQAIAFDAPGSYAVPRGVGDTAEWTEFLALLAGQRKAEPLNGVVLTVGADTLLTEGETKLSELGATLRRRLDEVTQRLGVSVPVYVLVTKCDRVGGMVRFFESFPPESARQALGGLNDQRTGEFSAPAFVETVCGRIHQRLQALRLVLLSEVSAESLPPQAVLFPEEFRELQAPLTQFVGAVFERGPYREPPFLRGLYFSSARQGGTPLSPPMQRLGLAAEQLPLAEGTDSFWLKDLFETLLVRDRFLVAPTGKALSGYRVTRSAGLAAWALVCAVLAVVLSVSFARNLSTIRTTAGQLPPSPQLGQVFGENLAMLDRLREAKQNLEQRNRDWLLPRLGLNHGQTLEHRLAIAYGSKFRRGILDPLDAELDRRLERVVAAGDPAQVARYADFLTTRIRLLGVARGEERSAEALAEQGALDFGLLAEGSVDGPGESTGTVVGRGYLAYLLWHRDRQLLNAEWQGEQARLRTFLSREGIGFGWLAQWANLQPSLAPVRLAEYWGAEPDPAGEAAGQIERAYTPEGWEAIRGFMDQIAAAVADEAGVAAALDRFRAEYRREYFRQWGRFFQRFPRGHGVWQGRERRLALAGKLAGDDSPYLRLLVRATEGLAPAMELAQAEADVPAWAPLVYRYVQLADPAYQKALAAGTGEGGGLAAKGGEVLRNLKVKLRGPTDETAEHAQDRVAYPHVAGYRAALKQAAALTLSPQAAYGQARASYLEAEARIGEPEQAISKAVWHPARLRAVLSAGKPEEEAFWNLLVSPVEQVWSVLLDETEVHLERLWQDQVLSEGQGLAGWELVEVLQGQAGKVWEFQDTVVAPFLAKDRTKGYAARTLYGSSLRFTSEFLRLLNRGKLSGKALGREYQVQVATLPTDANPGASRQPQRTSLVLQCGAETQELVNRNYPSGKTLSWSPGSCTDVTLEIAVGDVLLTRRYPGYDAFPLFLRDFRSGSRSFRSDDFPEQKGALAGYNVSQITVNYTFKGHDRVVALLDYGPASVPQKIVR